MSKKVSWLFIIVLIVTVSIPFSSHSKNNVGGSTPLTFTKNKTLTGGIHVEYSLVTLAKYKKDVEKVFEYTFSETDKIARLFHSTDPQSDLGKIEAAAGQGPVLVSKETLVLAKHAKEIAEWTHGAFNPVEGASYRSLKIDEKKSTIYLKKANTRLNLRGILEGFIADLHIRAAHHANLNDAFVRVNGAVRAMGHSVVGPWLVRLEGQGESRAKHGTDVKLSNYSVATAGGKFFAPTTNPATGKPIENPFYSVTVLAPQAATAQGIATAIYTMGFKKGVNAGKAIVDSMGIRAIYAFNDGRIEKIGKW